MVGMKIGTVTLIWTDDFNESHLELMPRIKEHGFDGLEVITFKIPGFPAAAVRRAAEQNGLELTFTTAFTGGFSFVSEDAAARRQAAVFMQDCVRLAADLGSKVFCGPFYAPLGYMPGRRRTTEEWQRVVEGLQEAAEFAARNGVKLGVEFLNRYETYFLTTAGEALALCQEVDHPNLGVLFDAYHANIEEKNLPEAVRRLGRYIVNVHASENDRGIPGSGHIDWPGIIQALKEAGYDGFLVIESFGYTMPAIAAATCIWRDLAPTPEDIAFQGVKYLRRLLA
jgi:D-psicose/D-tagatose/L-ribulose 3-epimerase